MTYTTDFPIIGCDDYCFRPYCFTFLNDIHNDEQRAYDDPLDCFRPYCFTFLNDIHNSYPLPKPIAPIVLDLIVLLF